MNTEKLIRNTAAGDAGSFEKLYKELYSPVIAVALSITRNRHDAEDVAAETFVTVWQKADGYRGGSGKGWVLAIARNAALSHIKAAQRQIPTDHDENALGSYSIEADTEDKMILSAALSVLDEDERETVLLYNSGLKHREIAEIRDDKLGTVTWRYKNALEKMKKHLKEVGYEK